MSPESLIVMHQSCRAKVNIKNNWQESYKHFPKMKSTTYIIEITNQKNERYLSEGRNPLAYSPPCLLSTKKFSVWVYWKVFCHFWSIKLHDLPHMVSLLFAPSHSYFSGNFLLSFLLWYDTKILVKLRGGGTLLSLALSVNAWE